jgi:hypothetical protein
MYDIRALRFPCREKITSVLERFKKRIGYGGTVFGGLVELENVCIASDY